MLLFPLKYPRRRRERKIEAATSPPSPPAASVVNVVFISPTQLLWTFSVALTAWPATCPQLEASDGTGGGEWFAGGTLDFITATDVVMNYEGANFDGENPPSSSYRVVSQPAGLVFAGGAQLTLPQAGSVS